MNFSELGLNKALSRGLREANHERPTPIQAQAIPPLLDGRDVLGCAQTGTGKTAAFSLPILQHLSQAPAGKRRIRALILSPTRELAAQIGASLRMYGKHTTLRHDVIFGGVPEKGQIRRLHHPPDILVATPGRLLDFVDRGIVKLSSVEFFVLDEADRMLDMGFVHDVRKTLKVLPAKRQNLLFSATLPQSIVDLAMSFLTNPVSVEVTPEVKTAEAIDQQVMYVDGKDKVRLLAQLLESNDVARAMVFTRTKHGANRLAGTLAKRGIQCDAIHGNKTQAARKKALHGFRRGRLRVLVATDVASRGIDVDDITHVFNYDLPNEPESYVHRIGRTARAGRTGRAISFCEGTTVGYLRDIEKLIGEPVPVCEDQPFHSEEAKVELPPPTRGGRSKRQQPSPRRGKDQGEKAKQRRPSRTPAAVRTARNKNAGAPVAGASDASQPSSDRPKHRPPRGAMSAPTRLRSDDRKSKPRRSGSSNTQRTDGLKREGPTRAKRTDKDNQRTKHAGPAKSKRNGESPKRTKREDPKTSKRTGSGPKRTKHAGPAKPKRTGGGATRPRKGPPTPKRTSDGPKQKSHSGPSGPKRSSEGGKKTKRAPSDAGAQPGSRPLRKPRPGGRNDSRKRHERRGAR